MRVQTDELAKAVNAASSVLATRCILPENGLIRLRSVGEKLVVSGTDNTVFVDASVPVIKPDVLDVLVEHKKLLSVLYREEFVDLDVRGKKLHVTCFGSASLPTTSADNYPMLSIDGQQKTITLSKYQVGVLGDFATVTEMDRITSAISVTEKGGRAYCLTTDDIGGRCICVATGNAQCTFKAVMLKTAIDVIGENEVVVTVTHRDDLTGYVTVRSDSVVVSFPLMKLQPIPGIAYVDADSVSNIAIQHRARGDAKVITMALSAAISIDTDEILRVTYVVFRFRSGKLTIETASGNYVSPEIDVECDDFTASYEGNRIKKAIEKLGTFDADFGPHPADKSMLWIRLKNQSEQTYAMLMPIKIQVKEQDV